MHKKLIVILVGMIALNLGAQTSWKQKLSEKNIFNHLDVGVNLGTTGVGLNLAVPVTDYVRIRAGVDYMPRFAVPMSFDIGTYAHPTWDEMQQEDFDYDDWVDNRFEQIQDIMYQLSGIEVERKVKMKTNGRLFDFKFLVDVKPFNDKRWHITAGFYYGSSRVAHTENSAEVMPALLAMKIYNKFYDYVMMTDFMDEPVYKDIYLDPDMADKLKDKVGEYGRIGVHIGDFKNSTDKDKRFMMEPGKDGMVKANMYVNNFKPYLGFGYDTNLTKDGRWKFGFDAGLLFWGTPKLMTHYQPLVDENDLTVMVTNPDGSKDPVMINHDLVGEVENIGGKVGTYVDIVRFLNVYPTINLKVSFSIF